MVDRDPLTTGGIVPEGQSEEGIHPEIESIPEGIYDETFRVLGGVCHAIGEPEDLREKGISDILKGLRERRDLRLDALNGALDGQITNLETRASKRIESAQSALGKLRRPIEVVISDDKLREKIIALYPPDAQRIMKPYLEGRDQPPPFTRESLVCEILGYVYKHSVRRALRGRILRIECADEKKNSSRYGEVKQVIGEWGTEDLLRFLLFENRLDLEKVQKISFGVKFAVDPLKVKQTLEKILELEDEELVEGKVSQKSSPRPETIRKSIFNVIKHYLSRESK